MPNAYWLLCKTMRSKLSTLLWSSYTVVLNKKIENFEIQF